MGTDSVIYIRTDGNSKIATGHFVRCLCIAQALESLGTYVCFLVSNKDSETLLQDLAVSIFQGHSFSYNVKILETAVYDNLESELEELKAFLSSKPITEVSKQLSAGYNVFSNQKNLSAHKPVILIDSYYVTQRYLNSLREIALVAYMDDLRAFDYNADLVINYDVIPPSKELAYKQAYTNAAATLLGAQYTPLRRQFQNQTVLLREKIQDILITSGGSDPYHFTETLVSYFLSQGLTANLHVVIGRLFTDIESLEQLAVQTSTVHLHYNVSDMASLMKQCDYAISAAGTTLYELCALGIPAISFTMADNQIIMAETFSETGAIPYAGDVRECVITDSKNVIAKMTSHWHNSNFETASSMDDIKNEKMHSILTCISEHFTSLVQNSAKRKEQHHIMRHLVDGNGAVKIAEALYNLYL